MPGGLIKWNGPAIERKAREAAKRGVNKTMSEAVISAKQNHPGWQNRTGLAEGSVDITRFAEERGGAIVGEWGSRGVDYVTHLEFNHGSFMRNAADRTYPQLADNVRAAFRALQAVV